MRYSIATLLIVLSLGLMSCDLFNSDDDPEPYTGGEISAVTFEMLGPGQVKINWMENFADEDGFYVDRQKWPDAWERKYLNAGPNETSVVDEEAELGNVYYYKVYAVKGDRESDEEEQQFNFYLPSPINISYEYNWNLPNRIRLLWTNNATWADSIVIAKKVAEGEWASPYTVVAGGTTEFMDMDFNINVVNTWGFTTHYQDHISNQYLYTLMPPNKGETN